MANYGLTNYWDNRYSL